MGMGRGSLKLFKSFKLLSNSLFLIKKWALLLSNTKFSELIEIAFEITSIAFSKFLFLKRMVAYRFNASMSFWYVSFFSISVVNY